MSFEPGPKDGMLGLAIALLSSGGARYAFATYREIRARKDAKPTPSLAHLAEVDANILTVVKARDELAEDNLRIRAILGEERAENRLVVTDLRRENAQLRADIAALEAKLRALLEELADLKARHSI